MDITYGQIRERLVGPLEEAGFTVTSKLLPEDMEHQYRRKRKFELKRGFVRVLVETQPSRSNKDIIKTMYYIVGGGGVMVVNWDLKTDEISLQSVVTPTLHAARIFLDLVELPEDRACVMYSGFESQE